MCVSFGVWCPLRNWLKSRGWQEGDPWHWTLEGMSMNLSLPALQANLHNLRQGWRWWCWNRFIQRGRHEIACAQLDAVTSAQFFSPSWKLIREASIVLLLLRDRWPWLPLLLALGSVAQNNKTLLVFGVVVLAILITWFGHVPIRL